MRLCPHLWGRNQETPLLCRVMQAWEPTWAHPGVLLWVMKITVFCKVFLLNNRIIFIKQCSIPIYKTGNRLLFWLINNACVHKELLEPLFLQIPAAVSPHSLTHIHIFKPLLLNTKESRGSMNIV